MSTLSLLPTPQFFMPPVARTISERCGLPLGRVATELPIHIEGRAEDNSPCAAIALAEEDLERWDGLS
jgi:hypothetical protein